MKKYLKDLASKKPIPGGGSASALVGALGAGLIEKTCNLTVGKEKYKSVEKEIKEILKKVKTARKKLEKLIKEDSVYYLKFIKALRLPKDTETQAYKRQIAVKKADARARIAPREIKKICESLLPYCDALEKKGNRMLVGDVKCARILIEAAGKAAENFV